jgi:hypothetical protein
MKPVFQADAIALQTLEKFCYNLTPREVSGKWQI